MVMVVVGCPSAAPSETEKREPEREPVAAKKEAPVQTPEPDEEAIPISLPGKSPPSDGGGSSGNVGSDESMSETFGPGRTLDECLSGCATRALSDDNRATCRLLCKSHYDRPSTVEPGEIIDGYVGCFDACEGELSCRRRCATEVAHGDACVTPCLDAFGRCFSTCEGGDDAGRCAERCETTARGCVGGC